VQQTVTLSIISAREGEPSAVREKRRK